MIRAYCLRMLKKFSARYDYDTTYMEEMVDHDLSGFFKLGGVAKFSTYHFGLPAGPFFAAKFVSTRRADCGACLGLVLAMAREKGVSDEELAAIDTGKADPDFQLAADFANAVLDRTADLVTVTDAVEARWGARGRFGLAAAVAAGQFFPVYKRGLGHGDSCIVLPKAFHSQVA